MRADISFGKAFEPNDLIVNYQVRINTSIVPAKTVNVIEFACDYMPGCDRQFLLDQMKWLLEVKYMNLTSTIVALFVVEDKNPVLCIDYNQNEEQLCSTGVCYLNSLMAPYLINGKCIDDSTMKTQFSIISFITTHENINGKEEQNEGNEPNQKPVTLNMSMEYRCRANKCNDRQTAKLMKQAVEDYYDLTPVYKMLPTKIKENSDGSSTLTNNLTKSNPTPYVPTFIPTEETNETVTTTTATATSTSTNKNTSNSHHISISIVIFTIFLFFFLNLSD